MQNDAMPLNIATALPQKAALAQGGFFAFAISFFVSTALPISIPRASTYAIAPRTYQTR
jgi:hypothetical protein